MVSSELDHESRSCSSNFVCLKCVSFLKHLHNFVCLHQKPVSYECEMCKSSTDMCIWSLSPHDGAINVKSYRVIEQSQKRFATQQISF